MIAKITKGTKFSAIVEYATQENKDHSVVSVGSIYSANIDGVIDELNAVAKNYRKGIKEVSDPCWQCSLSLHPDESIDDEKWNTIVTLFLEKMGIDDKHQHIAFRHRDTEHEHIHIIVNRVRMDGKRLWNPRHDHYNANKACQEIELELGLRVTNHGKENARELNVNTMLTSNEVEKAMRINEKPSRIVLAELIEKSVSDRPQTRIFVERLQEAGVTVHANVASTGKMNGFSFGYEDVKFKGSDVGAGWKKLLERIDYEQKRDSDFVATLRVGREVFAGSGSDQGIADFATGDRADTYQPGTGNDRVRGSDGEGRFIGNETAREHAERVGFDHLESPTRDPERRDGRQPKVERSLASGSTSHQGIDRGSAENSPRNGGHPREAKGSGEASQNQSPNGNIINNEMDDRDRYGDLSEPYRQLVGSFISERQQSGNPRNERNDSIVGRQGFRDEFANKYVKDREATKKAMIAQFKAIGIDSYSIVYMKAGRSSNASSDGKMITFKNDPLENVAKIKGLNVNGHNVYVKPDYSKHSDVFVIDDVTTEGIKKLNDMNMAYVLVETSSENYQVWLRYHRPCSPEERTEISRYYTEFLGGDVGAIGNSRVARVAGFTNQKEKHLDNNGRGFWVGCDASKKGVLDQDPTLEKLLSERCPKPWEKAMKTPLKPLPVKTSNVLTVERFSNALKIASNQVSDQSRRDFVACVALLKEGYDRDEIQIRLWEVSDRKQDAEDYARRTLLAAEKRIQEEARPKEEPQMDWSQGTNLGPNR